MTRSWMTLCPGSLSSTCDPVDLYRTSFPTSGNRVGSRVAKTKPTTSFPTSPSASSSWWASRVEPMLVKGCTQLVAWFLIVVFEACQTSISLCKCGGIISSSHTKCSLVSGFLLCLWWHIAALICTLLPPNVNQSKCEFQLNAVLFI